VPGSAQVGFIVDEVALGHVYSEYFCFPCQSSFHQTIHPHNHTGQAKYVRSCRRAEWTPHPNMRIRKMFKIERTHVIALANIPLHSNLYAMYSGIRLADAVISIFKLLFPCLFGTGANRGLLLSGKEFKFHMFERKILQKNCSTFEVNG
jgi:hypothetical protein